MIVVNGRLAFSRPTCEHWINGSMFKLSHVVDELDALTLILEVWVGECLPAAVLTLIFVGGLLHRHWKGDRIWAVSHAHRGDYRIRGRAYNRDGVTIKNARIRHIDGSSNRSDSQRLWEKSNCHSGDHRIA